MRRLEALVCVLALAASGFTYSGYARMARYEHYAAHFWRATPWCAFGVRYHWRELPAPIISMAEQPGCQVWIDTREWKRIGRRGRCRTLIHEWGHLLGHHHSRRRRSVMFREYDRRIVPLTCR